MGRRYFDKHGYERGDYHYSDLIHRQIAYQKIYLPNREKYPLHFDQYQVHHIDGDKRNNHLSNLLIVTEEQHAKLHGKLRLDYDDINWLNDSLGIPRWELKKMIANQTSFASISLLFGKYGSTIKTLLWVITKIGLIAGFAILLIYYLFLYPYYSLIKFIGFTILGIGIFSIFSTMIVGLIGLGYGIVGNVVHSIAQDIKRLFNLGKYKPERENKSKKKWIIILIVIVLSLLLYFYFTTEHQEIRIQEQKGIDIQQQNEINAVGFISTLSMDGQANLCYNSCQDPRTSFRFLSDKNQLLCECLENVNVFIDDKTAREISNYITLSNDVMISFCKTIYGDSLRMVQNLRNNVFVCESTEGSGCFDTRTFTEVGSDERIKRVNSLGIRIER